MMKNGFNQNEKVLQNIKGRIIPIMKPCDHLGSVIPMALIPTLVKLQTADGKTIDSQILLIKTAQCIRCGFLWEFTHQQKSEQTAEDKKG